MPAEERLAGDEDGGGPAAPLTTLPMDAFSVKARAAVELGQQSENALSYLDRKTDASLKPARGGTAWTRDQTKTGSVCQIVVRDTGFNMGVVLWRAVGLLMHDVNGAGDLHVVSTRSAFSDAFAVQYASCRFYKADGSALVWECRTDASKFFFPSPDFNPSPTPAMLSCAALESSEPQLPPWRPLPAPGPENGAGRYPSVQRGDSNNNNKPAPAGRRSETRNELLTEQSSLHSSATGTGESWGSTSGRVKSASSKNRVRQQECGGGDGGGNGGGGGSGGGGGGGIGGSGRGGGGGGKGGRGRNLMRPFTIDVHEELSHAHQQILRLGETVHLFQPPEAPGGVWQEMQATAWAIEQTPDGQVSVKYRVDPRGDREMLEGCPLLKKVAGRKFVPVGLHLGRYAEKEWTHHGLLLISGLHQMAECSSREAVEKEQIAEARIEGVKTSYRREMLERTKAHLSDVVSNFGQQGDGTGAAGKPATKLIQLSPEEAEALAEACEGRGVQAVLAILALGEQEGVRRPGLRALARLASESHQTLLEVGRAGGIEAAIGQLRELGECRDVQESACWVLALLSQVAEFSRRIGNQGGCEEVCKVLRKCAEFGSACPRVQLWALGCAANLLASSDNRRALLLGRGEGADSALREEGEELLESGVGENAAVWEEGEEAAEKGGGGGEAEVGMAGWIHTLFANSDRVSKDRGAQYAAIACVRQLAATGPAPTAAMRSSGVPKLIEAALERFGGMDQQFRDQATGALRSLSRDSPA